MFKDLDPVLHSQLRLAVMSILISTEQADFNFLKEKTQSTAGNLSVQITKLEEAGYIVVVKTYAGKRPLTICKATKAGVEAFSRYVSALKTYFPE